MADLSRLIGETAFTLHKAGKFSRKDLISIMQRLINAAALDNGYVDKFGLPFPEEDPR